MTITRIRPAVEMHLKQIDAHLTVLAERLDTAIDQGDSGLVKLIEQSMDGLATRWAELRGEKANG